MRRFVILAVMLLAGPALAQDDPGFLARFLQDRLSGAGRTVQISGFQGALSSRATLRELTIADGEGIWLTLRGVTLDWNRAAVLRGEFSVNELSASEIVVARPPQAGDSLPSPEARGFSLPELPVSVNIGRVAAGRVTLGAAVLGQPLEATLEASLRLASGEGQAALSLIRTDDGPKGQLTLDAGYSNTTRVLALDLSAIEDADGIAATKLGLPGAPQTELSVKGQGIIDSFTAEIRLATDAVDRLAGRVALSVADDGTRGFTATLAGNPAPLFLPEHAEFFGTDVRLDAAGQRSPSGALDLSRLSVRTEALSLDGTLALAPGGLPVRFALTGRVAHAAGTPVLLPLSGPETYVTEAEITLDYDAAQDEGWRGSASLQGLSHPGLAVDRALITGSGRIGTGPQGKVVGATLRLAAAGLRPADPALAQALGDATTGKIKLSWLQGQPLNLSQLMLAGSGYTIDARGKITGLATGLGLDGTLQAETRDLSRFSGLAARPLGGAAALRISGKGSLLGGDFDLTGEVGGTDMTLGQPEVDNLLQGQTRIGFSVARSGAGTEIRALDLTAATLAVNASGWLRSTGSDLAANLRFDDLRALGPAYRGALSGQARVTGTAGNGALTLNATGSNLAIGQAQADRMLAGNTVLALSLRTQDGALRIDRADLANPQLSVKATGQAANGRRQIDLSARLADLGLFVPEFPGALTVAGSARDDGAGYVLDLRGTGPGQIAADVNGRVVPGTARADITVTGTAQAALANPFVQPNSINGPLRFNLRLNGPLALRSLSGTVALANGRVAAPVLGLALQGVTGQAALADGTATVTADAGVVAGGSIGLRGTVGLTPPFPGDLTVTPRDMVLRDPDLFETRVNGAVRVAGPLTGGARISGSLTLPETEIRVPSTDITAAGAIPDITHRNEPAAVRATRARAGLLDREARTRKDLSRPYGLDLTISAPNRVFIRGRGLDTELGGTLRLEGTTEAVVPSGGIDLIRGRLDILGRRLDLTEGSIRLEGSLDPRLRVVATNSGDGVTSSVILDGSISEPEISFASSPQLPEEEVLAHLLFGRQLTSLSPLQAAQLANAVATLAGRGGEGIIGKLRRNFGLSDFDLISDNSGATSLRLGRYVAKNIYTEVIVGSEGTSQLNLNLEVRPGVTLRGSADSSGDTGIGVFVERDY
ncbi:MAG: translocation/assembly module TamB domain-containing protein [Rhodobacter sp.]|nr:translocation/assembly module TamB domain-containing protein [Rhodobacter sp.]